MPLPTCTLGQFPWFLDLGSTNTQGNTPAEACSAMVGVNIGAGTWTSAQLGGPSGPTFCHAYGHPSSSFNGSFGAPVQVCEVASTPVDPDPPSGVNAVQIQALNGYVTITYVVGTQTVVVEPPPLTEEKLFDLLEAGGFLMLALLVVFCSRALLDLLRTDSIKD